jgi:hypothetical protein
LCLVDIHLLSLQARELLQSYFLPFYKILFSKSSSKQAINQQATNIMTWHDSSHTGTAIFINKQNLAFALPLIILCATYVSVP